MTWSDLYFRKTNLAKGFRMTVRGTKPKQKMSSKSIGNRTDTDKEGEPRVYSAYDDPLSPQLSPRPLIFFLDYFPNAPGGRLQGVCVLSSGS